MNRNKILKKVKAWLAKAPNVVIKGDINIEVVVEAESENVNIPSETLTDTIKVSVEDTMKLLMYVEHTNRKAQFVSANNVTITSDGDEIVIRINDPSSFPKGDFGFMDEPRIVGTLLRL